jgi:hypothetical protein
MVPIPICCGLPTADEIVGGPARGPRPIISMGYTNRGSAPIGEANSAVGRARLALQQQVGEWAAAQPAAR